MDEPHDPLTRAICRAAAAAETAAVRRWLEALAESGERAEGGTAPAADRQKKTLRSH